MYLVKDAAKAWIGESPTRDRCTKSVDVSHALRT